MAAKKHKEIYFQKKIECAPVEEIKKIQSEKLVAHVA